MTLALTPEEVAAIKASNARLIDLAATFCVGLSTITRVRNGKWEADAEKRRTTPFLPRRGYVRSADGA